MLQSRKPHQIPNYGVLGLVVFSKNMKLHKFVYAIQETCDTTPPRSKETMCLLFSVAKDVRYSQQRFSSIALQRGMSLAGSRLHSQSWLGVTERSKYRAVVSLGAFFEVLMRPHTSKRTRYVFKASLFYL